MCISMCISMCVYIYIYACNKGVGWAEAFGHNTDSRPPLKAEFHASRHAGPEDSASSNSLAIVHYIPHSTLLPCKTPLPALLFLLILFSYSRNPHIIVGSSRGGEPSTCTHTHTHTHLHNVSHTHVVSHTACLVHTHTYARAQIPCRHKRLDNFQGVRTSCQSFGRSR